MYSDYRNLAPGVASDSKIFTELEASTMLLASRDGVNYELGFLALPNHLTRGKESVPVKFVQDDKFINIKRDLILGEGKPNYQRMQKYKNIIDEFLEENKTPTLGELRELNAKLVAAQIEFEAQNVSTNKNPENAEPGMC